MTDGWEVRAASLLTLALVTVGCDGSPTEPGDRLELATAVVTFCCDSARTMTVDASSGRTVASHEIPWIPLNLTLSHDRSRAHVPATPTDGTRRLLVFDGDGLTVLHDELLSTAVERGPVSDLVLSTEQGFELARNGSRFYVDAFRPEGESTTQGIAVLETTTWSVTDFTPLLSSDGANMIGGMAVAPGSAGAESGDLAVTLPLADSLDHLFWLDGTTFALRDSLTIGGRLSFSGAGKARDLVASPTENVVYVLQVDSLLKVRMSNGELDVTRSIRRPHLWIGARLAISGDGRRLFLTNPGDFFDSPGTGFVAVYDSELERLPDIDLNGDPIVESFSPRISSVAVGPDDRFLYVAAGSASGGPLFPPQRGHLYVIEIETGEIVRKIDLGLFGIDAVGVLGES